MNNIKKTILAGGMALCIYPSLLLAETCGTTPSCPSLGFTVPASGLSTACKDMTSLKCPFGDYYFCSTTTKTPQQKCLDEGYRLQNDWPKPTASNDVVVPSTMLANFMKNIFELKSAMAANVPSTPPADLSQGCPASMIASCKKVCSQTCQDYFCCNVATDLTLQEDNIPTNMGQVENLVDVQKDYQFKITATCPYDSNYVKGEWTLSIHRLCGIANCQTCSQPGTASEKCTVCDTGYKLTADGKCTLTFNPDINWGTGCNGTYRTCNGKKYCCPAGAKTPCDSGYSSQQSSMCFTDFDTSIDDKVVDPSL